MAPGTRRGHLQGVRVMAKGAGIQVRGRESMCDSNGIQYKYELQWTNECSQPQAASAHAVQLLPTNELTAEEDIPKNETKECGPDASLSVDTVPGSFRHTGIVLQHQLLDIDLIAVVAVVPEKGRCVGGVDS